VFVDIDNEGMARRAMGFNSREMVVAGKEVDPRCVIATNFKGAPPAEADLGIHFAHRVPGKPYIESEATPKNAPGGYWGSYSKVKGYYNYINIGVYDEQMKRDQISATAEHLDNAHGYMCASTWLQCVPPYGPNQRPGGSGSKAEPGIRWWLEFLRDKYGSYVAPTIRGKTNDRLLKVGYWERFEIMLATGFSRRISRQRVAGPLSTGFSSRVTTCFRLPATTLTAEVQAEGIVGGLPVSGILILKGPIPLNITGPRRFSMIWRLVG